MTQPSAYRVCPPAAVPAVAPAAIYVCPMHPLVRQAGPGRCPVCGMSLESLVPNGGLATPVSITVGIGRGAREGVLIRNAEALESMEKVDTLVVDKTATLTEERPTVQCIVATDGFDEARLLCWAASLEALSEHPLASAIATRARADGPTLAAVSAFIADAGEGVRGVIAGQDV